MSLSIHTKTNSRGVVMKTKSKKSATEKFLDQLRIPIAPPSITHTDRQNKRKKKFDYKSELRHY